MTAVVLQARMGSTRLPGKALLALGGATVVEQAMMRLALVPADARVLATDDSSASALAPAARRRGFELLVGPAEDVLARYCLAVRRFGIDLVVRATGDNPLVSPELAALLIERRASVASDYSGFAGMPVGMGVELVAAESLLRAEAQAREAREREHVCPYIYDHPELFRIDLPKAPAEYLLSGAKVTVDTEADYEAVLKIYGALYDGRPIPSAALMRHLRGLGLPGERGEA
jgi:spore coat polysaccharide biosynthesis protein SpsF